MFKPGDIYENEQVYNDDELSVIRVVVNVS